MPEITNLTKAMVADLLPSARNGSLREPPSRKSRSKAGTPEPGAGGEGGAAEESSTDADADLTLCVQSKIPLLSVINHNMPPEHPS